MVIHYIWCKNFNHLKEKGINFSSKYFITFKHSIVDSFVKGVLTIKLNPNYIHNFFEKENVKDVTAIIGKNGSGKTTVLEYIKSHFPLGLEANVVSELAVYSLFNEDGEEIDLTVIHPSNWQIEFDDPMKLFEKKEKYSDDDTFRFNSKLGDADYIYYTYNLTFNEELLNWEGLKNISTSALLVEERRRAIEERWRHGDIEATDAFTNDLFYFSGNEIAKGLQLLISEYKKDIPFTPPNSLTISISTLDRTYFKKNQKAKNSDLNDKNVKTNDENKDVMECILELEKLKQNELVQSKRALDGIYISTLLNYLVTERKYSSFPPSHTFSYLKLDQNESVKDFVLRFFKEIKIIRYPTTTKLSEDVPKFFELVEKMIEEKQLIPRSIRNTNDFTYSLQITKESTEAFNLFLKLYLRVKGLTTFFDFRWRNLSTGEQSYLSFMSRFYHLKNHAIQHEDLKKNLIIMIDEGDVGYHPEWQRIFFKKTLDFLSSLFAGHNLQLIFTANAPFITSDLPKANVVFIEKKENGSVIIHDKENNKLETFGSNIHTLYSDAFYMNGALIGEFAKNKIDTIIQFLRNDEQKQPNEEYKKTIELIGEPILRRKLQSMWSEKYGPDEEMQMLLKRIEEIKKTKRQ
ncbi:MAG TPA: AAA family ATPase [Bacteroidia bacterium]|nr:AAA family ATPase [Bacteroidia bacterium]